MPENIIEFNLPKTDTKINLISSIPSGKKGEINGVKNSNIITVTSNSSEGSHTLNVQNIIINGIDTIVGGTHGGNTIFCTSLNDCALIVNNCEIRGFYEAFTGFSDYKISNTLIYNYKKNGICAPGHLICYQENEPDICEILGKNQQLLVQDMEDNWEEANGYNYPSDYGKSAFYKFEINTSLNISIDYEKEELTGFTKGAYYYVGNDEGRFETTTKKIDPSWFGTTIKLKRNCSDGTYPEKDLEIPARPVLTVNDFTIQSPSSTTSKDGVIKKKSHISAPVEYSLDNGASWKDIYNFGILNIANGDKILLRQKAVANKSFLGEILTITMHACSLKAYEAKTVSCTEDGNIAYYECTTCGKLYKNADKTAEFTDISETVIKASGHNYSKIVYTNANLRTSAVNCSEKGTYWYLCRNCDTIAKDDPAATDKYFIGLPGEHNYVKVDGKPATCREVGEKEHYKCSICHLLFDSSYVLTDAASLKIEKTEHVLTDTWKTWKDNKNHYKDCKNCREIRIDGVHSGGTATCSKKAICDTCGLEYGELNPSNHAGGTEVRDAVAENCSINGYTGDTYCLGCNAKIATGSVVDATGIHTEIIVPGYAATCSETGLSDGKQCSVCGEEILKQVETPKIGHDYTEVITQPTCTEGGFTTRTCKNCGHVVKDDETPAKGHTPSDWIVEKAATTDAEGLEIKKCTVCGEKLEERATPKLTPDYMLGDINGDKKVTATDARLILRISTKLEKLEDQKVPVLEAADANKDGKITATDARKVLRVATKLEEF